MLANNVKHLGFKSNVWVEDADRWWWGKITTLKTPLTSSSSGGSASSQHQRATEIAVTRIHEYYNMDCVSPESREELMRGLPDPKGIHHSFSSKAPFAKMIHEEFESCARQRCYASHYWLSPGTIEKRLVKLLPGARIASVQFPGKGRFFNAEQFEHPSRIETTPVSAYKRLPYGGATLDALRNDMIARGWKTGLYFSLGQLELFDLTGRLQDGAEPVEVTGEFGQQFNPTLTKHRLYNMDEVEKGDDLLDELNRFPVEEDTFLISGNPVVDEKLLAGLQRVRARYSTRYWLTKKDCEGRGYKLKPDAVGVSRTGDEEEPTRRREMTLIFYNVHQLENPDEGFALAGTRAVL